VLFIAGSAHGESLMDFACGSVTKKIVADLADWSVSACKSEVGMNVPKKNAVQIFESFNFNQGKECVVECSKESDGWESCANRYRGYFVKGIKETVRGNGMQNVCNKIQTGV